MDGVRTTAINITYKDLTNHKLMLLRHDSTEELVEMIVNDLHLECADVKYVRSVSFYHIDDLSQTIMNGIEKYAEELRRV